MISKDKYSKAKDLVLKYEEELRMGNGVECFILKKENPVANSHIFVTTNEEFAEKTYDTGDYVLIKSVMINP